MFLPDVNLWPAPAFTHDHRFLYVFDTIYEREDRVPCARSPIAGGAPGRSAFRFVVVSSKAGEPSALPPSRMLIPRFACDSHQPPRPPEERTAQQGFLYGW